MLKTIKSSDNLSLKEIEGIINSSEEYDVIEFEGVFRFENQTKRLFTLGKEVVQGMLMVKLPNLTLDFSKSRIFVESGKIDCELTFLYIFKSARNIRLNALGLQMRYSNTNSKSTVYGIYNCGHSLSIKDFNIEIISSAQINAVAVCNYGGLDTHLDTQADNLSIVNSRFKVHIQPESFEYENTAFGLRNYFANSMQVSDCYFDIKNKGSGETQKAIGIYNNGRFCRFSNNNIKANASHNIGKLLEEGRAVGMIDEGMYSLIANCNIVGEWGGSCIGLNLNGEFTKITGCKILSTHTIKGTTVKIEGRKIILSDNILTSTSRNARIIYSSGDIVTIQGNIMEVLMNPADCRSSVGAYIENGHNVIFTNNQLRTLKDCGLYFKNSHVTARDNIYQKEGMPEAFKETVKDNLLMEELLNENNICSLPVE